MPLPAVLRRVLLVVLCGLAVACGGRSGGGGSGSDGSADGFERPGTQINETTYTPGEYLSSSVWKDLCTNPRVGTDPTTGLPYADVKGSTAAENHWLRSWTHDYYLWYDEVPDIDPGSLPTGAYFEKMKTPALTDSGQPKDRFHFSLPTTDWLDVLNSSGGADYGLRYVVEGSGSSRSLRVSFVEPSPAPSVKAANIRRGATIISVDGIQVSSVASTADADAVNRALVPSEPGESHRFEIRDPGQSGTRTVTLTAARITTDPVPLVKVLPTATGGVGYILFNDHVPAAERGLVKAMDTLAAAGVKDLVLDLRYNGGGILAMASQLAYMVAGAQNTAGKVFEYTFFNDKYPGTNPFTGAFLQPLFFRDETLGLSLNAGLPLPSLGLSRVFVLVSGDTCSASESLINGLRGINIEVVVMGKTTCGKPYGFVPADNCGTTYFSVNLRGENAKGFGDFGEGFSPANDAAARGVKVLGCKAEDGLGNALGDPGENMLFHALAYRDSGTCPSHPTLRSRQIPQTAIDRALVQPPALRSNKFLIDAHMAR